VRESWRRRGDDGPRRWRRRGVFITNEGFFVKLGQKIACAVHMFLLPFLQTDQLDGISKLKISET
jgi:hypothetical protein